jgi:hypothetical protein
VSWQVVLGLAVCAAAGCRPVPEAQAPVEWPSYATDHRVDEVLAGRPHRRGKFRPGGSAVALAVTGNGMRDLDHLMLRGLLVDRSSLTYDAFMATRPQRAE